MTVTRLASVSKKKTATETKVSCDGVKEIEAVSRKAKKVRFSPESENEVFEFTRSLKKSVRSRRQEGHAQGIELRRSKRIVANGILDTEKDCCLLDVTKAQNVPRRSKRIGFSGRGGIQEEREATESMALVLFGASKENTSRGYNQVLRRSTRLAKNMSLENTNELSMEFEVQETREQHGKDMQLEPKAGKVPGRCRRIVSNTQDRRRSVRLKAIVASTSVASGTS